MNNTELIVKPGKEIHRGLLISKGVFIIVLLAILSFGTDSIIVASYVALSIIGCLIILYIFVRLFYNHKYVFTDEYVSKYIGKKIVFKIDYDNITDIYFSRIVWHKRLLCLLLGLRIDVLFFHFNKPDILCEDVDTVSCFTSLKKRLSDPRMNEFSDYFTHREAKRIAAIIGKPLKYE